MTQKDNLETRVIKAMLFLERYEPMAYLALEKNLELAQNKILELISSTTNQKVIRAELKKIMNDAFINFAPEIIDDIETVSELSYNKFGSIVAGGFVTDTLSKEFKKFKSVDKAVKDKLLSPNRLILGNNIDDLKNQMILGANQKLRSSILQGFNDKVGIDKINQDVKMILGNLTQNQAKTVTRTILLNAIEEAKNASFESFEDEIDYWVYSAVLDTRTSIYCRAAHGYKTKDKTTAKYKVKSHWNCRSLWTIENEMTREFDKMYPNKQIVEWDGKTVNHRDGTKSTKFKVGKIKDIPKTATGYDAFNALDDEYKLDLLGKTRYKLYKDGKATFREMADVARNRFIPLDELRRKLKL